MPVGPITRMLCYQGSQSSLLHSSLSRVVLAERSGIEGSRGGYFKASYRDPSTALGMTEFFRRRQLAG